MTSLSNPTTTPGGKIDTDSSRIPLHTFLPIFKNPALSLPSQCLFYRVGDLIAPLFTPSVILSRGGSKSQPCVTRPSAFVHKVTDSEPPKNKSQNVANREGKATFALSSRQGWLWDASGAALLVFGTTR